MKKTYNVISHTHWDREWYFPFEKFRMRLVDMVDHVLEIMEREPDYIFHLDAQTIVLEDYLEIRTGNRGKLETYVREGRLIIGPWYVQNDFYLTSGEATVRNLILGTKIANEYGACAKVGYAPDQFGNISQLPQILQNFGMDNFIFGRGYQLFEKKKVGEQPVRQNNNTEFIWEGPDGSRLLAIYMKDWYNNAQRFSQDVAKSLSLLEQIDLSFENCQKSGELLLMNGVDHLEAQEDLLPILNQLNSHLPRDSRIIQTTMADYIKKVKAYFSANPSEKENLTLFKGELRKGLITNILQNTLSSRPYLKRENFRLQNLLVRYCEPLYTLMEMMGPFGRYPTEYMEYLWKELIKNHPHDSICGCSHDSVHRNMEDRFNRIDVCARELLERGLEFFAAHVNRQEMGGKEALISLINTQLDSRSEVVRERLFFPAQENVKGFSLLNGKGEEINYTILSRKRVNKNIYSAINLPGVKEAHEFQIQFQAREIPAMGYEIYRVIPHSAPQASLDFTEESVSQGVLENDYLRLDIDTRGRIDLLQKESGRVYRDIHKITDEADVGDAYRHRSPVADEVLSTEDFTPVITLMTGSDFETTYKISYDMALPAFYDFESARRSEERVINKIDLFLTLKKDMKWCEFSYEIDNKSRDHRLRTLFQTGIQSDISCSDSPFDLVYRDRREVLKGITTNGDQPNSGFVSLKGAKGGVAVFNKGVYEYEHYLGDEGILAFTLLRTGGYISRDSKNLETLSPAMITPEGECLRKIKQEIGLRPFSSEEEPGMLRESAQYQSPLLTHFQSVDMTIFNGGRPAVQGSCVSEIFYRKDPWASVMLPVTRSMIKIEGDKIILSALKQSEKGEGYILRVFNGSEETQPFHCTFDRPLKCVQKVTMGEEVQGDLDYEEDRIRPIILNPKEILTLKFQLER